MFPTFTDVIITCYQNLLQFFFAGHLGNFRWELIKFLRIRIALQYIFYLNCNSKCNYVVTISTLCSKSPAIELAGICSKKVFAPKENGSVRRSGPHLVQNRVILSFAAVTENPFFMLDNTQSFNGIQRQWKTWLAKKKKKMPITTVFYAMAKIPFPFLARGSHFIIQEITLGNVVHQLQW